MARSAPALLRKLTPAELADVLGNSVRIHQQGFDGLGRRNDEQSKQLRKAYSRKSLRLLEEPAQAAVALTKVVIEPIVQGLMFAADRAGLVVSADGKTAVLYEQGQYHELCI